MARFHRWCARHILGIATRVEGAPPVGAALVAVKHQSMYETLEIVLMLDQPALVMKRELTRIPLWGWVVRRYGVIAVDRGAGASALRAMMRAGAAALAEGRAIIIFPEGTRVPPGEAPPLTAGFRRPLPCARPAGGAGSGRQRPALASPPMGQAARRGHHALRCPDPPGLRREVVETAVHRAINALEPHT